MSTREERFVIEYNEDGEVFELQSPSRPHRTGGTMRDIITCFGEEGDAQETCNNLNDWLASAPSLKEEVERVTALWGEECRIKKTNEAAMNELIGRSITERDALKEENEKLKEQLVTADQNIKQWIERYIQQDSENKRLREALQKIINRPDVVECKDIASAALNFVEDENI